MHSRRVYTYVYYARTHIHVVRIRRADGRTAIAAATAGERRKNGKRGKIYKQQYILTFCTNTLNIIIIIIRVVRATSVRDGVVVDGGRARASVEGGGIGNKSIDPWNRASLMEQCVKHMVRGRTRQTLESNGRCGNVLRPRGGGGGVRRWQYHARSADWLTGSAGATEPGRFRASDGYKTRKKTESSAVSDRALSCCFSKIKYNAADFFFLFNINKINR